MQKTIKTKFDIEKAVDDFVNFLQEHTGKEFTVVKTPIEELIPEPEEEISEAEFNKMKPAAFDILLNAEKKFFSAMVGLERKHSSLTTVEQIDKLTKEILKLCK